MRIADGKPLLLQDGALRRRYTTRAEPVRPRVLWLCGISALYFVCAGLRAAYRPLWYDELVTWHISRLGSIAAMWHALVSGIDQEMPLTHLSVRFSHALFGDGN